MKPSRVFLLALILLASIALVLWLRPRHGETVATQPKPPQENAQAPAASAPAGASTQSAGATNQTVSPVAVIPAPAPIPKRRVPTFSDAPATQGRPPAGLPLASDFLDKIVDASGTRASFALPDGRTAEGAVELLRRDARGVWLVQGRLVLPERGFFFLQRQTAPGVAGTHVGNVRFDKSKVAFRVEPTGPGGAPMLVERNLEQVVCYNFAMPEPPPAVAAASDPQNAPQTHPIDIPIPSSQNGVVPLQSRPGAIGVIYLDFDGEAGPFPGWGNFDAAPSGANNTQIKEVWQRVSEDFQAFNLNVTTDRRVFDSAPGGRRQHVMVSPTNTAAPGAGGVAYIGSFNNTGDTVCWAFYTTGKNSAEVISHEVGHTLGLGHDGRNTPSEGYYGGQGSGDVGWAPIMGVGYSRNLTQWSKGEYTSANNTEDDLAIIVNNNNDVDYRADDYGATFANAGYLEILANNSISNEGIIETSADVDAFRFTTAGGAVSLTASVVNAGPNVDLLAEIYDSANVLVASNNPDTGLNATVAATLAAGDFTLRVSGVGRGNPATDGYSDYASLGAYLITGTVAGGVKPDRFSIAENSANGTSVGTVTPRNSHGANPLAFAITSGNGTGGGAFAINPATGALTVADFAQLNFETLSTQWDDPATFQLSVSITDATAPALNETVRVVVTVTDVNEVPSISAASVTVPEHARVGTKVIKVTGSDPDRFEFPVFTITAGNTGNAFAIDADSGQITIAADTNATTQSVYNLTVRASDHGTPALTATATVTITLVDIPTGYVPGGVTRTFFENITGEAVSNLTSNAKFPNNPDSEEFLTAFDGGEHGDNYGSTVRGYLIPPTTGNYTFWIASDDSSELRISTNATPGSATVRTTISGYSDQYQWTKFGSQQSAAIALTAGQVYYIEARQKEGGGGDHVAAAWQGPGFTRKVIDGVYLAPFVQNYAPKVPAQTFTTREGSYNGAPVGTVQVTDVNAQDTHSAFTILGGTGASVFGINATTGLITVTNGAALNATTTPSYTLTVRAADSATPALTGTGTITINVAGANVINVTGIVQQIWTGISGGTVANLTGDPRYPNSPTTSRTLASFDTGDDYTDNYGSRIRGYVIPPTTGSYTFYIASDDASSLLLSTNDNPANATQIASIATWVARDVWTDFPSQTSAPVTLTAGQRYYIETLHKEGGGGDFVQVAWTGPGIATQTILPGSALQPFDINVAPAWNNAPYAFAIASAAPNGTAAGTVAASDPNGDALVYTILSGNPGGNTFAINPQTGAITVANSSGLPNGQRVTLQIGVQDNGGAGTYPLKSATTTAAISVGQLIALASPTSANVNIPNGVGLALTANNAGRTGTTIAWTKVSGIGNVTFESPAALATGATFSAAGNYILRCAETSGTFTTSFDFAVNVGVIGLGLAGAEVGEQTVTPSHTLASGIYTISAAGNGIPSTGTPDDFYFLNVPATGNVTVTARLVSVAAVNGSNSRAGVMIRESLAADAREAFCGITSANGARFIYRATAGTNSANATGTGTQPGWVRLIRSGNSFTAQVAPDSGGTPGTFVNVGSAQTLAMGSSVFVGLAATSGSTTTAGTVVFSNVTITPTPVNIAATVSAGPNASVTLPAAAALNGTVSDDGKPTPPASVTTAWSKISGPGSVSFGNTAAIDTTATLSTPGVHVLRLSADDGQVKTFDDVAITVQLAPIDQWRQLHFGADAGNPLIAGDLVDFDFDGLVNLLEYALALDPKQPGVSSIVADLETIGADTFLRLTVPRNPNATDITLSIEVTGDLLAPLSWTTTGTTVETNTSTLLRVRDNIPTSTPGQRNIRLKVTHP